jgi:SAM-dependent methyltransferase
VNPPATSWAQAWREIVVAREACRTVPGEPAGGDVWARRAEAYDERIRRRWAGPDTMGDHLRSRLSPSSTLLDIGAGTGMWAIPLAPHVAHVTAVEPSPAMAALLERNLAEHGIRNAEIVRESWPEARVAVHDVVLCSHAVYGVRDLPAFVRAMVAAARRECLLMVRAPSEDSLVAQAGERIWGQPGAMSSFRVAYRVLLEMGIDANVILETGERRHATSSSPEGALAELKDRIGLLADDPTHDAFLADLLESRLIRRDGLCEWPGSMRSALISWDVS